MDGQSQEPQHPCSPTTCPCKSHRTSPHKVSWGEKLLPSAPHPRGFGERCLAHSPRGMNVLLPKEKQLPFGENSVKEQLGRNDTKWIFNQDFAEIALGVAHPRQEKPHLVVNIGAHLHLICCFFCLGSSRSGLTSLPTHLLWARHHSGLKRVKKTFLILIL